MVEQRKAHLLRDHRLQRDFYRLSGRLHVDGYSFYTFGLKIKSMYPALDVGETVRISSPSHDTH